MAAPLIKNTLLVPAKSDSPGSIDTSWAIQNTVHPIKAAVA